MSARGIATETAVRSCVLVAVALVYGAAQASGSGIHDASAVIRHCGHVRAYYHDHGTKQYVEATHITAKKASCKRARHVAHVWAGRSRLSYHPAHKADRFKCTYTRVGSDIGSVRCHKGKVVIRFDGYDSSPYH